MAPPGPAAGPFSLKHLYREAELLSTLGLLSFSRSNQYLMPSPEGYQFLASMEIDCHAPTKRPYAQSSALRRRLEVGTVLLTCLGAGIEPAYDKVDRLKRQPVFSPRFRPARRGRQSDGTPPAVSASATGETTLISSNMSAGKIPAFL